MKSKNKIFSLLLSLILLAIISYLTFFVNHSYKKIVPKEIQVAGNNLLSQNDYLVFTKLQNDMDYKKISEAVIKDRFEKHPYVYRADVEVSGRDRIEVNANEKNIYAVIIVNSEPYLISDQFQVLPLLPNINTIDVPVINNIKKQDGVKVLSYLKNEDMIQAFRIIDAARELSNKNIIDDLSEINLNSGLGLAYPGDVVITFSGLKPAVIFGRGAEAEKMIYLEALWDRIADGQISFSNSDYVDLRYAHNIYVGSMNNTGVMQ